MSPSDQLLYEKCLALVDASGISHEREIAAEMMLNAMKLASDSPGRGEMKLMLRAFKELRYAFKIFKPYRSQRKISIFGSARTAENHANYILAKRFAKLSADAGYMVITGAGGGIMAAGNEGAGHDHSFGVAIKLPFEQRTNAIIEGNEKLIHFRYFFSRKLVFVKETHAIALFPGGFGTHDEGFEVLTLVQTGRCDPLPIVLIDQPGGTYWKAWDEFIRKELLGAGLISPEDPDLYFITDDPQAAIDHVNTFYRNYHSLRYHNDTLLLRLKHAPTAEELAGLQKDFADILTSGTLEVRKPDAKDSQPDVAPVRLAMQFDRRSLARLRHLIDRLNRLASLPPVARDPLPIADTGTQESDRGVSTIAEEESLKLAGPGT